MKVTPKPAICSELKGPIGRLIFSHHRSGHVVRRPWTISTPPTAPQITHRQAVADSHALWSSVPSDVLLAWQLYTAPLNYSPFCAWGSYNIVPLKTAALTTLCPSVTTAKHLWTLNAVPGADNEIDLTWVYTGSAGTDAVLICYRELPSLHWVLFDTVNADDRAATITALAPASDYEVAIVCRNAAHSQWDRALHAFTHPGRPMIYQEYYPNSALCSACHWNTADPLGAALVYPRGHSYTQDELNTISLDDENTVDCQTQPPPPWDQAVHTLRFHIDQDWEAVEAFVLYFRYWLGNGENISLAVYDWGDPAHFDYAYGAANPPEPGFKYFPWTSADPPRDGPPFYVLSPGYIYFRVYNTSSWDQWTKINQAILRIWYFA